MRVEVHHGGAPVTAVFSSGLGLPLELWHPVVQLLPEVRCVLLDRPAAHFPDQVQLLADALTACAAPAAPEPAVVVGNSHGGFFAEGLARSHPDLVRGLVLVDASDPGLEATRVQLGGAPAGWAERLAARPSVAGLVGRPTAAAVLAGGAVRPAPPTVRSALVAAYGDPARLAATVAELAAVRADALALLDLARTAPLPPVPVHLVVAASGPLPVRHRRRSWLRRMTRRAAELGPGTVRTDVDAGHLVLLDAPDAVARAVRAAAAGR